jgi:hypothetical protein
MIIGLGYKARSGKDTIAEYLVRVYGFRRVAFADSLKEACRQIFSFTDEQLYGDKKEVVDSYWEVTPRYVLQKVGTECMREGYDKDIWIKSVEKKIRDSKDNWVITDMRFPNEAEAVKRWGGFLVRVDRPNSGATGGIVSHPSEIAMDSFKDWDYALNNDSNVHAVLYEKVEDMLAYFKEAP